MATVNASTGCFLKVVTHISRYCVIRVVKVNQFMLVMVISRLTIPCSLQNVFSNNALNQLRYQIRSYIKLKLSWLI